MFGQVEESTPLSQEQIKTTEENVVPDPQQQVPPTDTNDPLKENEESGEEEENEEELYVAQVDKMHGFELPVDYTAEDGSTIDPDSVEGLYRRDLALAAKVETDFMNRMKQTMPEIYRGMLHMQNGGSWADFERKDTVPKFDDVKDNLESQKSLFKQSWREKGVNDEDQLDLLLENSIKKEKLKDEVQKYLTEKEKNHKDSVAQIEQELADIELAEETNYKSLGNLLDSIYDTNNFPLLRIPDVKKAISFDKFANAVQYDRRKGEFSYSIPITKDNIQNLVQLDYIYNNPTAFSRTPQGKKEQQASTIRDKNKAIERQASTVSIEQGANKISLGKFL